MAWVFSSTSGVIEGHGKGSVVVMAMHQRPCGRRATGTLFVWIYYLTWTGRDVFPGNDFLLLLLLLRVYLSSLCMFMCVCVPVCVPVCVCVCPCVCLVPCQ
ncbi:hypothetical protein V8C26DRAFT_60205 [Trichoderma gracile]